MAEGGPLPDDNGFTVPDNPVLFGHLELRHEAEGDDVRENLVFPWSEYTLPDEYSPIVGHHRDREPDALSGSGNSAATDPFDVDSSDVRSETAFDEAKEGMASTPRSRKYSNSNSGNSENSAGFDFTDLETEGDTNRFTQAVNITSPASFGFAMPDMGFFGVASPPNYYKIHDWMTRDVPIYRHRRSSSSEDSNTGPTIPIRTNAQHEEIASPRSIPNSPPQSPLYKRQATKQAKIFEDINENCQLINTPALFLQSKKCYDLIPNSGKLIVFDKNLLVRKAFTALIAHGTRAAPIWDSSCQAYTGMLTITDFINILHQNQNKEGKHLNIANIIENKTIEEWKVISEKSNVNKGLISIDPMETLFTAAKILLEKKIHRLPVIDPRSGNTLYILTHKRILNHIYPYIIESKLDPFFSIPIQTIGVGTYENVKQLRYDSKLLQAMECFAKTKISAIPIVDDELKVVDIYARFDVITLASRGKYNDMDMTIRECLQLRSTQKVEVLTCRATDSLIDVIKSIYSAQVHRLVVVDDTKHVVGLVSLSDLFRFLVFRSHYSKTKSEEKPEIDEESHFQQFEFG
ncbi:5'-AMP-activated protein kinase subunit gamma-1-like isoform X3 [Bolinopsis microptera]|uniref:5'-AMP-activated protein kinase subunit gamma-1-like isoform X3 n=1 Tax=Bolinopsis microptera TaxID=2820187 RepID=UPI00307A0857